MCDSPFTIAVIATVYFPNSHTDVIVSRWLEPRPDDPAWGWLEPKTRIVSLFVDQFAEKDMARGMCAKHNVPLYESVSAALCRGGETLDVDGVLLIGEHGDYPETEIGQKMYPRKEFFDHIVKVFQASGRSVPVFCDKHLSWNFDWALQMDQTACDMGFMFLSSSSIPLCQRVPELYLTSGHRVDEAVAVFYGGDEAYGYHSYEFVQAILENRAEGETGVKAITVYRDDDFWRQLEAGRWSEQLMLVALEAIRRENPKKVKDGSLRNNCMGDSADGPTAICLDYRDGMRVTHLNLSGHITSWGIGIKLDGHEEHLATAPKVDDGTYSHGHFATMSSVIEKSFLTGHAPFSRRRSLITTGITAISMQARANPGVQLLTPELAITYDAMVDH